MPPENAPITSNAEPANHLPAFGRGAGEGGIERAAQGISSLLRQEPGEAPAPTDARNGAQPHEANQNQEPKADRTQDGALPTHTELGPEDIDDDGNIVEGEDEGAAAEKADGEGETRTETDQDQEPPGSLADLAERLGVDEETLLENIKLTVKRGDSEEEVNLATLRSEGMMERDYRHKTAEVNDYAKQVVTLGEALQQERQHYAEQLGPQLAQWQQAAQAHANLLNDLRDEDPHLYYQLKEKHDGYLAQFQQAAQEKQALNQRQEYANQQARQRDIGENVMALVAAVPEWEKNPSKGREEIEAIKEFAVKEYNIPKQVIDGIYQAPYLLALRDAQKYRKLLDAKKTLPKKRANPPAKYSKPGTTSNAKSKPGEAQYKAAKSKLAKSGNVRDLAAALLQTDLV